MMEHERIIGFLDALRCSHECMEGVFLRGGCYELGRVLQTIEPSARLLYDSRRDHVYTEIGGRFYDIQGEYVPTGAERRAMRAAFYVPRDRGSELRLGFRGKDRGTVLMHWTIRWRLWVSRAMIRAKIAVLPRRRAREVIDALRRQVELDAVTVDAREGLWTVPGLRVSWRTKYADE